MDNKDASCVICLGSRVCSSCRELRSVDFFICPICTSKWTRTCLILFVSDDILKFRFRANCICHQETLRAKHPVFQRTSSQISAGLGGWRSRPIEAKTCEWTYEPEVGDSDNCSLRTLQARAPVPKILLFCSTEPDRSFKLTVAFLTVCDAIPESFSANRHHAIKQHLIPITKVSFFAWSSETQKPARMFQSQIHCHDFAPRQGHKNYSF